MKKTGTDYIKPFAKEIFGVENEGFYPYPREELIKQPIYPYFVLDGGAFNLMKDQFGTADGDKIAELTLSGELFEIFKHKGNFSWEASFGYTDGTDFMRKYEWQLWPQRLYFAVPLAHKFLQTGDRKYADAWLTIVKEWHKAHPYKKFDADVFYLNADLAWRDMQVAWRTLSILHGMFMLSEAPFTKDDWKYLYSLVEIHVGHLYSEAVYRLSIHEANNHFLQVGVAILFAVSMFPELKNANDLIKTAHDVVEINIEKAIEKDGGWLEASPSYGNFIARLCLDSLLIIDKNKYPEVKGLRESVKKQYEWLYRFMTPDGKSLPFADSFSLDSMRDLEYVSKFIDIDFKSGQKSVYYPESRIAVFRKGDMTLFADAAVWPGPHHHAGTPQIISFYKGEPILVDTGVCSYDRWEFYDYLHEFKAHNVVYNPEFEIDDCKVTPKIQKADVEKGEFLVETLVENKNGQKFMWTREILISENKLEISDKATSDTEMPFKSRLLFKQNDVYFPRDNKNKMQLLTENYLMTLTSEIQISKELAPVMNDENNLDYAVICETKEIFGKEFTNKTVIEFEER